VEIHLYPVIVVFWRVIPAEYNFVHGSSGWLNHNICICDSKYLDALHGGRVPIFWESQGFICDTFVCDKIWDL